MANAFYSLYSHVSRTPLQKLAPPEPGFAVSPAESKIGQRFFGSVRSEPRSPVERFKDTVSKMCLYTGPSLSRGSDPASPQKRNSLPDVVGMVMGSPRSEVAPEWEPGNEARGRAEDATAGGDEERRREPGGWRGEERGGARETDHERVATPEPDRTRRVMAVRRRLSASGVFRPCLKPSPSSDLAGPAEPLASRIKPGASFAPVPKISQDVICPQITESVRLAPYSCVRRALSPGGGARQATPTDPPADRGGPGTEQRETGAEGNKTAGDEPGSTGTEPSDPPPVSPPLLAPERPPCCITVTGWEGDVADGYEDTPGYAAATPVGAAPTSDPGDSQNYLSPTRAPSLGQVHHPSDPQANSFELEEVPMQLHHTWAK